MCHVEQPIQHGRPRYLVEGAQPINGDDCSLGILFAEALEHMSNALTPCMREKRELIGGPRNRSWNQSPEHVSCNNPSHTPIWIQQCRQAPSTTTGGTLSCLMDLPLLLFGGHLIQIKWSAWDMIRHFLRQRIPEQGLERV